MALTTDFRYSAAVEFVSSEWESVTRRAHYKMNDDGVPILVEARLAHSLSSNDDKQITSPIQKTKSAVGMSQCDDQATASVDQPLIQVTVNENNDTSRLSSSEQQPSSSIAASAHRLEATVVNELDSSLSSCSDQPQVELPISDQLDETLEAKFDQQVTVEQVITGTSNDKTSDREFNIHPLIPSDQSDLGHHKGSASNCGNNKPSMPSHHVNYLNDTEPKIGGTKSTPRYMTATNSSAAKQRKKVPVTNDKINGDLQWNASTKLENPDGPTKPLPPMDNYRKKMSARKKRADALMQIEENKYVALELNSFYRPRAYADEQFKWVDGFGWICKDEYIYRSLPLMGDEEDFKSQYIIEEGKQLGDGVYIGWRRSDNKEVAIKKVNESTVAVWGNVNGELYPIEYCHLRMVSGCSRIANLLDAFYNGDEYFLVLETMDACNSITHRLLFERKPFKESHCKLIFRQLVEAVEQCHNSGIFHRDIKLANILLEYNTNEVKLIDFDASALTSYSPYNDNPGTNGYMSPEMYDGSAKYDGSPAAVYSMGVVLYDLIFCAIGWKVINPSLPMPVVSTNCLDLICWMTADRLEDRIPFDEIIHHPWMQSTASVSDRGCNIKPPIPSNATDDIARSGLMG